MADVTASKRPRLTLHSPAIYRIRVGGLLKTAQPEYLLGLAISREDCVGGLAVITLDGEFANQAALLQVLNHLLDQGITLLSVEHLPAA